MTFSCHVTNTVVAMRQSCDVTVFPQIADLMWTVIPMRDITQVDKATSPSDSIVIITKSRVCCVCVCVCARVGECGCGCVRVGVGVGVCVCACVLCVCGFVGMWSLFMSEVRRMERVGERES